MPFPAYGNRRHNVFELRGTVENSNAAWCLSLRVSCSEVLVKERCPHCKRAKEYRQQAGIQYTYHDVVRSPRALYEMLARVFPIIGHKTPITVPQIWLGGRYIGGDDQLDAFLQQTAHQQAAQDARAPLNLKR